LAKIFSNVTPKTHNFISLKKVLLILLVFASFLGRASHNRSGEITYKRIAPFTAVVGGFTVPFFKYQITLTLYTDDGSTSNPNQIADRCTEDSISFGDNTIEKVDRSNGGTPLCITCSPCGCAHCGEIIINELGYRVKKNIYIVEHVYPGPGNYVIRVFDRNRNKGVQNIPTSDQQPFYVESLLMINGFTGANTSPEFKYTPIDRGCTQNCFYHNPGAFDADGDSLSYVLTSSRGENGLPILGYTSPDPGPNGTFNINPITGLVTWCTPQLQGEYNIAFVVYEWRRNTSGTWEIIGSVLRDMQVLVKTCVKNNPPYVVIPPDTCVEAGSLLVKKIRVTDPDSGNVVTLVGEAGMFASALPLAALSKTTGIMLPSNNKEYFSTLTWQTNCSHIRQQAYYTVFKVQDNADPHQVFFSTYAVRVVPPAVKNVTASPQGSAIKVTWDASTCNAAANPLYRYRVYRQKGCVPFNFQPCQIGVPTTSGYQLVGNVSSSVTAFTDTDNGNGLVVGQNYSYLVMAIYKDSSQTFGGTQVCAELKRDVPLITNVDVTSTSYTSGTLDIKWQRPMTTAGNLDLSAFPGPYKIKLMHRDSATKSFTEVFSSTNAVFTDMPLAFTHSLTNTATKLHEYYLSFYSDTTFIGNSQRATSVFLSGKGSDRKVDLSWQARTPWDNKSYKIFRRDSGATTYIQIATSTVNTYADQNNVINKKAYEYYIETTGEYSDPTIIRPLINRSEEILVRAIDKTPPVSPTLTIDADCSTGNVKLKWTDISIFSDDVASYSLWYKASVNEDWVPVTVIKTGQVLEFRSDGLNSIAGCYAVNATDSNGNVGELSPDFCIDNCPEFDLPNVFTPNNDGVNDYFMAIKVRQVKEINLSVVDRWGNLVYTTNDPEFKWNGVSQFSKLPASEGTFFYVCEVFEWRVSGIAKRTLKGIVQLIR
jgi:gliding motility-associated-like protein